MNREALKSLGLNDEQIDAVMAAHGQATGNLTQQVAELTTERDNLQNQVTNYGTQIEELKTKSGEELTNKIEEIKQDQAAKLAENEKAMAELKKGYEVRLALQEAGARNAKAVEALLDPSIIKIEDGKVVGISEQIENLKNGEDTSFLFQEAQATQPPKPAITFSTNSSDPTVVTDKDPFDLMFESIENGE